jgi:tetratricopeptide (TPR) repeat protein
MAIRTVLNSDYKAIVIDDRKAPHSLQLDRFVAEASWGRVLDCLTWHDSDLSSETCKGLADDLMATYHVSHSVADLEDAIGMYEEALRLRPAGHGHRAESLNDLGDALYHFCYHHEANETRGGRCIELLREGLRLRPSGHPLRDQSLHNLARSLLSVRYPQLGGLEVLLECASLDREALELRPFGHHDRLKSMGSLASDLERIFEHTGDMEMHAEIVIMRREVLRMLPPGHSLRQLSLNSLGTSLCRGFERLGCSKLIAEAISVIREAMKLCPVGHPQRPMVLDNLAYALALRSVYEGHTESEWLSEAIALRRRAFQLLPDRHPERVRVMGNLADSLLDSFQSSGDGNALAEAISLLREAVTLRPPGAYAYDNALNNLAEALEAKFDQTSETAALSEALKLHRDALHLRPIGHRWRFWSLEGLARVLCRIGPDSWSEALSCYEEALQLCPIGHPGRRRLLSGMSKCFLDPSSPSFSLSKGISCLSQAYAITSHVSGRLKSAVSDLEHLEVAYSASKTGSHADTHTQDDERILNLYAQIIGLLPLAANFGIDHGARLQAVTGSDEIARNAAARAMVFGHFSQAVELLEQGRGVFWTQTLHLRTTTFDGVPETDCQELQRMLRLLERDARRVKNLEQTVAQRERELESRRQLNETVQALISKIRGYAGLDRFLLPPAFDALLGCLPDGFVALVNASKLGHHALLLHGPTGLATGLTLKPLRAG